MASGGEGGLYTNLSAGFGLLKVVFAVRALKGALRMRIGIIGFQGWPCRATDPAQPRCGECGYDVRARQSKVGSVSYDSEVLSRTENF